MNLRSIARHVLITVSALTAVLSVAALYIAADFRSALPLLASSALTAVSAGILGLVGART